jgi:DNA mismatch endonuclease (patch repair protein)
MSRIRSRWTAQERTIHSYLKGWKIKHRMHPAVPGRPDIVVEDRLAVYLNGCFWHGCPRCYVPSKSRQEYWHPKIQGNRARDKKNLLATRRAGYRVIELWEHDYKRSAERCARRIVKRATMLRDSGHNPVARLRRSRSRGTSHLVNPFHETGSVVRRAAGLRSAPRRGEFAVAP